MIPTRIDHRLAALATLPSFKRRVADWRAMARAIGGRFQSLEDLVWDALGQRSIDNAEGAQLDRIGRLLNRPRGSLSNDDAYRVALRAELLVIRSAGTIEQLYGIFLLIEPTAHVAISEHFPAKFQFDWFSPSLTSDQATQYAQLAKRARGAGIGGTFYYYTVDVADVFRFSSITLFSDDIFGDVDIGDTNLGGTGTTMGGPIVATGFGTTSNPSVGGKLAGIRVF